MIKTAFAAAAAAVAFAAPGAALAGPYVNVEANSGFTGLELQRDYYRSPCGPRRSSG